MRIAFLSPDPAPRGREVLLQELESALAAARASGAELLVTPEIWGAGGMLPPRDAPALAEPSDGPLAQAASGLARRYRTALVLGYLEQAFGKLFSAAVVYGPDGCARGHYRRCHLLAGDELLAAGSWLTLAPLGGRRLGLSLGADILLPEAARCLTRAGATLLVHLEGPGPAVPLARERFAVRAAENGLPLAVAAYGSGAGALSGLYLPDGSRLEPTGTPGCVELGPVAALPRPQPRPELYRMLSAIDGPADTAQPSGHGRDGHDS